MNINDMTVDKETQIAFKYLAKHFGLNQTETLKAIIKHTYTIVKDLEDYNNGEVK